MSNAADNPTGHSRRRVLKTLGLMGAGAVLMPDKWVQPIVNSLIEPAEADCVTSVGAKCELSQWEHPLT
jgi:hypothetical protein